MYCCVEQPITNAYNETPKMLLAVVDIRNVLCVALDSNRLTFVVIVRGDFAVTVRQLRCVAVQAILLY